MSKQAQLRQLRHCGLLGLALLTLFAGGCSSEQAHPDVLIVVLDTVRADRLAAYGHERSTGLLLEKLAREHGVLFEDVTAPSPWTWPSHASLFTGESPWVHGAHLATHESGANTLEQHGMRVTQIREDLPTLAERFAAAGYRTVGLASNPWLDPELGLMRGFKIARLLENDLEVVEAARAEIAADPAQPLFLFVNLMAAHMPYYESGAPWLEAHGEKLEPKTAPAWLRPYLMQDAGVRGVNLELHAPGSEYSGVVDFIRGDLDIPPEGMEFLRDLYDGELARADRLFSDILERWTSVRGDQIVVVTSDHGEYFGEHGMLEHRGTVYTPVLRVPLICVAPGRLPAGQRIKVPVSLQRVYPTLLDLAGIATPPGSLLPLVRGEESEEPIAAAAWPVMAWARQIGGRLERRWQLYREHDTALVWDSSGTIELYDLSQDPSMTQNLIPQQQEQADKLLARARVHFLSSEHIRTAEVPLSPDQRKRLRALGYVGN